MSNVIVIRVLGVEGDRVKLGIDAPPDVIVVREELLDDDQQPATPAQYQPQFRAADSAQVYRVTEGDGDANARK